MSEANKKTETESALDVAWEEIRKLYPGLPSSRDGWHQHTNGGGWVHDNCDVSADTRIDAQSYVADGSRVLNGSRVDGSSVLNGSRVDGSRVDGSSVLNGSRVLNGSCVDCSIVDGSIVDGSRVDAEARLSGGTHTRNPIWIRGTRYSIGFSRPGFVASGCITKPLAWWLEHVERCAEEHRYTAEQRKEYRLHVEHIAAWMRLYGVDKPEESQAEKQG